MNINPEADITGSLPVGRLPLCEMMDDDQETGSGAPTPPTSGRTIIRLADADAARPDQIFHEMRHYWESLRQGRAVPLRASIEQKGIRRGLDYAFILERVAPGGARFRLAGKHLIDLMGMEVRGMPFCSVMNATSRGRLSDVLESVFKIPQIAEIDIASPSSYGRPELRAKVLLLPLRSDLGDVTRALGCLISTGRIGRTPRRFDLVADEVFPVIPGGMTLEPSPSAQGFSEEPPPWTREIVLENDALDKRTPEERRARFRIVSEISKKEDE